MAARGSGAPRAQTRERQVDFIDHYEHVARLSPMIRRHPAHRIAAQVHERFWFGEQHAAVGHDREIGNRTPWLQPGGPAPGKLVDDLKTKVVPRAHVLGARIPKADDKLHFLLRGPLPPGAYSG